MDFMYYTIQSSPSENMLMRDSVRTLKVINLVFFTNEWLRLYYELYYVDGSFKHTHTEIEEHTVCYIYLIHF